MHRAPWWWPRFGCARKRCRDIPCLLNDACWLVMSALLIVLLFAYAAASAAEATEWFVVVPPR